MSTVRQITERAAITLRDFEAGHEFTTWTKAMLLEWLNEGLCQLSALRPDLFTATRKITLKPGANQTLPDGIDAVYDINGNVLISPDGTETVEEGVTTGNQKLSRRFKKKPCLVADDTGGNCGDLGDGYKVKSFIRNPYTSREFRVEPPVPEGVEVEVMATVLLAPGHFDEGDYENKTPLSCSNDAALLDWILMRAYEVEIESEYAARAKVYHAQKFYHETGQKYFADSRMTSGYVLGQKGSGDERSGPPRDLRSMTFGGG